MPEQAAPAAPAAPTAPSAPAAASTEASTSPETPSLGKQLADALNKPQPPKADEQRRREEEHWKQVLGRQSQELGELRKQFERIQPALTPPTGDAEPDFDALYADPRAFADFMRKQRAEMQGLREKIRQEVLDEISPQLAPVRSMGAMEQVSRGNALASKLLANPETLSWLETQNRDEDVLRTYADPARVAIEAALWRYVSDQINHASVAPSRPEDAGAASPPPAGGTPPARPPEEPQPKSMKEAVDRFNAGLAELRAQGVTIR